VHNLTFTGLFVQGQVCGALRDADSPGDVKPASFFGGGAGGRGVPLDTLNPSSKSSFL
jgi:hypothetical protein